MSSGRGNVTVLRSSPRWWPRGRRADLLAGASYLLLGFAVQAQVWLAGAATHSLAQADAEVHVAYTGWFPYALARGINPLFNPTMSAPGGVNLMRNTSWPLLSALASPSSVLFGPIFSWNLLSTLAPATAAMAAYALCRRLDLGRAASFLGGLLFGFSASELAALRTGHLQGSFVVLLPLTVLCLVELLKPRRLRPVTAGVLLGLCLGAELLVSAELLVVELVVLPPAGLLALLAMPELRARWRRILGAAACALASFLVVVAYPYWYYLHGPQAIKGPVQLVAQAYRVDLAAFVLPTKQQLLSTAGINEISARFSSSVGENGAYLGLGLVAFCLVVVVALRRDRRVVVIAAAGGFAALLSLGGALTITGVPRLDPSGAAAGSLPLPGALLARLPGLADVIPSRFTKLVTLAAALLVAFGMDALGRRVPRRGGRSVLLGVLVLLLVLPLWPTTPRQQPSAYRAPAFFATRAYQQLPQAAPILTVPYPAGENLLAARWLAQARYRFSMPMSHVKVPNASGNVAFDPELGYGLSSLPATLLTKVGEGRGVRIDQQTKRAFLDQLATWRTHAVVSDLSLVARPALMRSTLVSLLGPPSGGGRQQPYWLLRD